MIWTHLSNAMRHSCVTCTSPSWISPSLSVFSFSDITRSFVQKYSSSLTKKAIDRISACLLKDSAHVITLCLSLLLRSCILQLLPNYYGKRERWFQFFQSGVQTSASNYTPNTILPVLSKIIEKSVHHQLYAFLKRETILDNRDNSFITGVVFIDLSRAFVMVDHQILKKLHCIV